jgi:hypothetical protein
MSAVAAVPAAATLPSAAIAALQSDPIFAAIEAHRRAHSKYELATIAADVEGEGAPRAHVIVAYSNDGEFAQSETDGHGGFTVTWKPNGKRSPVYADANQIEGAAPRDLQDDGRKAWIAERCAELKKEEMRIAKAYARTKRGKLEAAMDKAYDGERGRMWDLIWTKPTTIAGLCALLEYCRTQQSINALVHDDEWEDALEWTIESAVRALAGPPEPPMTDIVVELYGDAEEERAKIDGLKRNEGASHVAPSQFTHS